MPRETAAEINRKLLNKKFNKWTVIGLVSDERKLLCRCDCGTVKELFRQSIVSGASKSCGCLNSDGIKPGDVFGYWTVIGYTDKTNKVKCQCICGNVKELYKSNLNRGHTVSCGCTKYGSHLIGQKFGKWTVIDYGKTADKVLCKCECGTVKEVFKRNLIVGESTSCGCGKTDVDRDKIQIQAAKSKDELVAFINENFKDSKPHLNDLSRALGLSYSYTAHLISVYGLKDMMESYDYESKYEDEIRELLDKHNIKYTKHDRTVISPYELDIYIPEKKLAIEFNGDYWHSTDFKDKNYHFNKYNLAKECGVDLIQIFEYEWKDKKDILESIILSKLGIYEDVLYARNLDIKLVESQEEREFLNNNHLQGYVGSRVALGLYSGTELKCIMTFGKSRFGDYDTEILRLCYCRNTSIVGGAEKLFKYFIQNYNPKNIVSYCDITKFNGNIYTKLGMRFDGLTQPNYVWSNFNKVYTRQQTMKHKLVEQRLGTEDQTEDEIMRYLGFVKIYNCGNMRFIWEQ